MYKDIWRCQWGWGREISRWEGSRGSRGKIDEFFGKSTAFSHMFVYILVVKEKIRKRKYGWLGVYFCVNEAMTAAAKAGISRQVNKEENGRKNWKEKQKKGQIFILMVKTVHWRFPSKLGAKDTSLKTLTPK